MLMSTYSSAVTVALLAAVGVERAHMLLSNDRAAPGRNGSVASGNHPWARHTPATLCLHGHVAPTILLLGAQKCGSTSLWSDLIKHNDGMVHARPLLASEPRYYAKEQHFFDLHFHKGMAFYVSRYPTCKRGAPACYGIDASPTYLRIPGTAARVHAAYVGHRRALRMIVILRNPTDRVLSWYGHIGMKYLHVNVSLNEFAHLSVREMRACAATHGLTAESDELWASPCRELHPPLYDALTGGLYAPQIAEWLRWFPASQIALVTFGGYMNRTGKVLHDLTAFIGQRRRSGALAITAARINIRSTKRVSFNATAHAALTEFYRPHVDALIALLHRPVAEHMFSTPFSPVSALTAHGLINTNGA